jgi:hypothetical protein
LVEAYAAPFDRRVQSLADAINLQKAARTYKRFIVLDTYPIADAGPQGLWSMASFPVLNGACNELFDPREDKVFPAPECNWSPG